MTDAVRFALWPWQIVVLPSMAIVPASGVFTVTVTLLELEHPVSGSVAVREYWPPIAAVASGTDRFWPVKVCPPGPSQL